MNYVQQESLHFILYLYNIYVKDVILLLFYSRPDTTGAYIEPRPQYVWLFTNNDADLKMTTGPFAYRNGGAGGSPGSPNRS